MASFNTIETMLPFGVEKYANLGSRTCSAASARSIGISSGCRFVLTYASAENSSSQTKSCGRTIRATDVFIVTARPKFKTGNCGAGLRPAHVGNHADIFVWVADASKNVAMNGDMAGQRPAPPFNVKRI